MNRRDLLIAIATANEYTPLTYIQSTGTQYIDTGVSGGSNAYFKIVFEPQDMGGTAYSQYLAGDKSVSMCKMYQQDSKVVFEYLNTSNSTSYYGYNHTNSGGKLTIEAGNNKIIVGSTTGTSTLATKGWGTLSYYVCNSHSETTLTSKMKLYSLQMKTDNALVRDFVPVKRNSDGAIGLYDQVEKKFYANIGTGEFLYG